MGVAQSPLQATHRDTPIAQISSMDAIRKKMQSLKAETEGLYATIKRFEDATKEFSDRADQADCDIRDYSKKVQQLEIGFDETNDKLQKATESLEEEKKAEGILADTITKLALSSKDADSILKEVKHVQSKCMNNEVTLEEYDKNLRATTKMASDNEQKLDEMSRKLGVQEVELKRGIERAEIVEKKLKDVEAELEAVGENMKILEESATKALSREEKLIEKIYQLQEKYKNTEARFEYGEMNITKLNQRIDDIEDEIYREKLKIKKCSDELDETFDDMISHY